MPPRTSVLESIRSSIPPFRHQSCLFHTSRACKGEGGVDHYNTLGLDRKASPADIKRKFYDLSKHHHPDRNPNDPHAAERFVKISEAYAILGHTSNREKYDREIERSAPWRSHHVPRGSHSSSTPYGARPASGLSRRRTQFRGPPPSFFRNGGWGAQTAKRQRQADTTASTQASSASASDTTRASSGGGYGSGSTSWGFDYDVSHFDRDGHMRTQEQQDQRRQRRTGEEAVGYSTGGNVLVNFIFVSGMLAAACLIPALFSQRNKTGKDMGDG
ncbi:MAG: hypothetical protein Q9218_001534 [Villophora microphyllina]